jgi:hypothetical protein
MKSLWFPTRACRAHGMLLALAAEQRATDSEMHLLRQSRRYQVMGHLANHLLGVGLMGVLFWIGLPGDVWVAGPCLLVMGLGLACWVHRQDARWAQRTAQVLGWTDVRGDAEGLVDFRRPRLSWSRHPAQWWSLALWWRVHRHAS